MRDRLTELIINAPKLEFPFGSRAQGKTYQTAQNIADHILADGWIRPPCKVGQTVWDRKVEPYKVVSIEWFSKKVTHLHCISPVTNIRHTFSVGKRSLGKTVFLAKEEAEKALEGRENNG